MVLDDASKNLLNQKLNNVTEAANSYNLESLNVFYEIRSFANDNIYVLSDSAIRFVSLFNKNVTSIRHDMNNPHKPEAGFAEMEKAKHNGSLIRILGYETWLTPEDRLRLGNIGRNNEEANRLLLKSLDAKKSYENLEKRLGISDSVGSQTESNRHFPQDTSDIVPENDMPSYTDPED